MTKLGKDSCTETMPIIPFNDIEVQTSIQVFKPTRNGIDTLDIDAFRQGVEVSNERSYPSGITPRMRPGNQSYGTLASNHQYDFLTFGIAVSIAKATDEIPWVENHGRFNAIQYLTNREDYPFPIYLNGGREAEFVTKLELFTIPDNTKENLTDFPFYARRVFGYLCGGNNRIGLPEATDQLSQFIPMIPVQRENQEYFFEGGYSFTELGIRKEGYISTFHSTNLPFNDTTVCDNTKTDKLLVAELSFSSSSDELKMVLENNLQINNNSDLRPNQKRSSCAGMVYGAFEAYAGTDSLAFGGLTYLND